MIDKNLVLYLPFDDPDGNKAYDYSYNRSDATLSMVPYLVGTLTVENHLI